jgi:hypothetical protein
MCGKSEVEIVRPKIYRPAMRAFVVTLFLLGSFAAFAADAVTGQVVKVLPFFLDQQGRDAKSPSLFDRDAYQAYLRDHTNEISAVRYDVLWQATKATDEKLELRAELRGTGAGGMPKTLKLVAGIPPGTIHKWNSLTLGGDAFKDFGSVVAWRVTLWNGGQLLGEQKSFLW